MKFWKQTLLTTIVFLGITSTVLYTACEKDGCVNVSCQNGGSCAAGVCRCPSGYEGTSCETLSRVRYLGIYGGYTTCNGAGLVIDSVYIYQGNGDLSSVRVTQRMHPLDTLDGEVMLTQGTYSIVIATTSMSHYFKKYSLTLQDDKKVSLFTDEEDYQNPADTIINKCNFLGTK